tara:strand:- start:447 stop:1814 length:1368 start_codon:yes stop_codon:yes gene_type:complete
MSKDKELTTAEIRKLIRAHNVLMSIKIPTGSNRIDIINLVKKNGYDIDHVKKALVPVVKMKRKPNVTLKKAEEVIPKPKPKTEEQKKKIKEKKEVMLVEKAKEIKLAKKEGVKEFKAGQKKGIKDSGRNKTNSEMKPKQPKSTNTKKALKKEDEVRPKEKVGKVKFDPKNVKVVGVKQKPIIIGAKPKGGRIETGTLNKGKVVSGAKNKVKVDKRRPAIDYRLATFYGKSSQGGEKSMKNPTYKELIDTIGSKYGSLLKQPSKSQEDKIKSFLALDPSEYYRSPQTYPTGINIAPPQYQPDKRPYVEIYLPYGGLQRNQFSGKVKLLIKDPSAYDEKVGGGAEKKEDKKSPFTDDEVKLINDLLHGSAKFEEGDFTFSGKKVPKNLKSILEDKNPISAKGVQRKNFIKVLKVFIKENEANSTDDQSIQGLDGKYRTYTIEMRKLGLRLLTMENWV